ncbi:transcription factor RFX3-like [Zootermopsis nevadensis]|uniref:transcription factor RFX3-like n=1 Tax=Zootermopsis nevadensis TaxID=136037 RepID=UPI000B8E31A9|nr:transcription factor RFX3-like [Zootermopsis nevadensis]
MNTETSVDMSSFSIQAHQQAGPRTKRKLLVEMFSSLAKKSKNENYVSTENCGLPDFGSTEFGPHSHGGFFDATQEANIQQFINNEHVPYLAGLPFPLQVLRATNRDALLRQDAGRVACMVPGTSTTNPSSLDGDVHPDLSHTTRVSPATVQWLVQNYEVADDGSLPHSTLYNHYLRHCSHNKLDPVNAASFGKLIRSVFLGLRTRRLGPRGNSKYHYYGIRLISGSSLNQLSEAGGRQQPLSQHPHHHQFLGDGSGEIHDFPEIEFPPGFVLPEDCTLEDVDTLRSIYREHCEGLPKDLFPFICSLCLITYMIKYHCFRAKLYLLSKCGSVQQFVRRIDYLFYQNLVEVLIPDVLRPIPSSLTQAIRNFAKGLDSRLTAAMTGCPEEMVNIKVSAVSALAQSLWRYTSLNHLAQTARAILQNSAQINQMLVDLNRVDFHNVQEQALWVCQCDDRMVQQLEADFKVTLQRQCSLEEWAARLKGVVTQVLKPYEGKPNFAKVARQFLLKWSFYSSIVIRDLTLRSVVSFGSFHLIRLLYDEYMFFLIGHQVALETGETPIAVMGGKYNNNLSSGYLQPGPCNGGISLSMRVPVSIGGKMDPTTLLAGNSEVNRQPVATKRPKIS